MISANDPVTAIAHPNIAYIKYWGNRNDQLRIPENGSISMNLSSLETRTSIGLDTSLNADTIEIDDHSADEHSATRISGFLSHIRHMAGRSEFAQVNTSNNFPSGSGIASSASGFAALAIAASSAYGLHLSESELSRLARRGSGSASRSIPRGFVEWLPGNSDNDSFAASFAPEDHWDLVDIVAIVDSAPKKVGSTEGHQIARTSIFQDDRVKDTPRRLQICRKAILERNFNAFAEIVEQDCLLMHSIMMTSSPALIYWKPATLELISLITKLRSQGMAVGYTIDAGPNVHIITVKEHQSIAENEIRISGLIQSMLISSPGGGAYISD